MCKKIYPYDSMSAADRNGGRIDIEDIGIYVFCVVLRNVVFRRINYDK